MGQGQAVFHRLPKDYQAGAFVPPKEEQRAASDAVHGVPRALSQPSRKQPQRQEVRKELTERDIIKAVRAELHDVEREITRLEKLAKKRDALRRLLAAADNRPLAVVRELSRAAR